MIKDGKEQRRGKWERWQEERNREVGGTGRDVWAGAHLQVLEEGSASGYGCGKEYEHKADGTDVQGQYSGLLRV